MKTLIHVQRDTSICIYNLNNENITGSFFKEKPEVGDVVMSWTEKDVNFLKMFHVKEIVENRDGRISSKSKFNPEKAFFRLRVEDVTHDERFKEVDNSTNNIR
jgi:hypothetical protein